MRSININDIPYELPTTWQEVIDNGHYMDVVRMLSGTDDEGLRKYELFKAITGFDPLVLDLTETGRLQLSEHMVMSILPCFDFIYDPEQVFIKNPIPTFEHDGVTYHGPDTALNNQTGLQWEKSHQFQVLHDRSKDIRHLHQLVYTNYTASKEPEAITPLPDDLVYGICLWYGKCEKWWSQIYPWLFPSGDDTEEMPGTIAPPSGREIKDMLFKLAGSKLNADWDIVRSRSRQDIIFALDEMEKERERIEMAKRSG